MARRSDARTVHDARRPRPAAPSVALAARPPAAAALGHRPRFVHGQSATVQLLPVPHVDRLLAIGCGAHLDEAEAARLAGLAIGDDAGRGDRARLPEGSLKIIAGDVVGQIADEVLQHLSSLNADIEVTVEIQVKTPDGVPDATVRTVTENCRTLKFISYEFEED